MFLLTEEHVDIRSHIEQLSTPQAGACVTFEGWVRIHNNGKKVLWLEYEAYKELALSEGLKIMEQSLDRFEILEAFCVHRTGKLKIGDVAVWIGVSAVHRKPAFEACESIIDQIKTRVPIWKKEHYDDGDSGWILCDHCAKPPHSYL